MSSTRRTFYSTVNRGALDAFKRPPIGLFWPHVLAGLAHSLLAFFSTFGLISDAIYSSLLRIVDWYSLGRRMQDRARPRLNYVSPSSSAHILACPLSVSSLGILL